MFVFYQVGELVGFEGGGGVKRKNIGNNIILFEATKKMPQVTAILIKQTAYQNAKKQRF